jgi:hypothetical protein
VNNLPAPFFPPSVETPVCPLPARHLKPPSALHQNDKQKKCLGRSPAGPGPEAKRMVDVEYEQEGEKCLVAVESIAPVSIKDGRKDFLVVWA